MSKTNNLLPSDRLYDAESYLWAMPSTDEGRIKIGLSTLAIESLGDLIYLTLQRSGATVARGDSIGSMEAAKMTGEILSPLSGTIVDTNASVIDNPLLVSSDPYGTGWLAEIESDSWDSENTELCDAESLLLVLPDDLLDKVSVAYSEMKL